MPLSFSTGKLVPANFGWIVFHESNLCVYREAFMAGSKEYLFNLILVLPMDYRVLLHLPAQS